MLRITPRIEVAFRKKESTFTKSFWQALLIALSIHLILFMIFRVVAPSHEESLKPLNPVAVEVDLGSKTLATFPLQENAPIPYENVDLPKSLELPQIDLSESWLIFPMSTTDTPTLSAPAKIEYIPFEESSLEYDKEKIQNDAE